MNQTFNIKRFLRYTRFVLSMNRWYYGVLLVLFTIPATVLSLYGVADWLVAGLVGAATFCLSIVPTYDLTALTGWERQLTVPSSWLEKLIVEIVARYWVLIVPFCIHAFGCALGLNGISTVFADGFSVETFAIVLLWTPLYFWIYMFHKGRQRNPITGNMNSVTPLYAMPMVGSVGFLLMLSWVPLYKESPLANSISLLLGAVFFVAAIITYPKKRAK
ncbi:MAG: hypothetical protein IKW77_04960 [Salinivirgaceae bacterium]|nr:hypothetical protein [Salinivirgaceae bacterium]